MQGLKSRAAFKLLEINEKYKLFRGGDTVVDLGYAPGSWSQVAISRTEPYGRVIGIDIIPAQPPKGVSTIQGNFLSPDIQAEVRSYVQDSARGRMRKRGIVSQKDQDKDDDLTDEEAENAVRGYIELERYTALQDQDATAAPFSDANNKSTGAKKLSQQDRDAEKGRVVDVVLSDMSAPWEQTSGLWVKSVSNPYRRMMNTTGVGFKDHAGSMVDQLEYSAQ